MKERVGWLLFRCGAAMGVAAVIATVSVVASLIASVAVFAIGSLLLIDRWDWE